MRTRNWGWQAGMDPRDCDRVWECGEKKEEEETENKQNT